MIKPRKINFRNDLYDYLSEKCDSKEPARLVEIERVIKKHLPIDNEELLETAKELINKLNSSEHEVSSAFRVNKTGLNRYKRIVSKNDRWNLEFDKRILGSDSSAIFYYDERKKTLTINSLSENDISSIEQELNERKIK